METLKNPYEEKAAVNPWPEDMDPDQDHAAEQKTFQVIKNLVNSLVVHVALRRKSNHFDDHFPVNETVKKEAQAAKNEAIGHMKDLLQEWEK